MRACFAAGCLFQVSFVNFDRSNSSKGLINPPLNTIPTPSLIFSLSLPADFFSLPRSSLSLLAVFLSPEATSYILLTSVVSSALVAMETYGDVMWLSHEVVLESCDPDWPIRSSRVELQPQAAITLSNMSGRKKEKFFIRCTLQYKNAIIWQYNTLVTLCEEVQPHHYA